MFYGFQVRCAEWPAEVVTLIYPWLSNAQFHAYYCHLCCGMCISYLELNYIKRIDFNVDFEAGPLLGIYNGYELQ